MLVIHSTSLHLVNPNTHAVLRVNFDKAPAAYDTANEALETLEAITQSGVPTGRHFQ